MSINLVVRIGKLRMLKYIWYNIHLFFNDIKVFLVLVSVRVRVSAFILFYVVNFVYFVIQKVI